MCALKSTSSDVIARGDKYQQCKQLAQPNKTFYKTPDNETAKMNKLCNIYAVRKEKANRNFNDVQDGAKTQPSDAV